jgi:hypothetical protein
MIKLVKPNVGKIRLLKSPLEVVVISKMMTVLTLIKMMSQFCN